MPSLGAGVLYAPDYLGSDDYETRVWPTINVSYGVMAMPGMA
ncbi:MULTISPECIES: MipA/OmpV family protein [Marinobacter]|jgi:outer membrane protein|nr:MULTISPECIES: MipA/OmpV family protein [unclassified Marinobacter]